MDYSICEKVCFTHVKPLLFVSLLFVIMCYWNFYHHSFSHLPCDPSLCSHSARLCTNTRYQIPGNNNSNISSSISSSRQQNAKYKWNKLCTIYVNVCLQVRMRMRVQDITKKCGSWGTIKINKRIQTNTNDAGKIRGRRKVQTERHVNIENVPIKIRQTMRSTHTHTKYTIHLHVRYVLFYFIFDWCSFYFYSWYFSACVNECDCVVTRRKSIFSFLPIFHLRKIIKINGRQKPTKCQPMTMITLPSSPQTLLNQVLHIFTYLHSCKN